MQDVDLPSEQTVSPATPEAHAQARVQQRQRFLVAAVLIFLAWLLLTGSLQPGELVVGAGVAVLTAWLSGPHLALLDGIRYSPALPWHLARFAATFLKALLLANLDVARRVVSPRLPIRPAVVQVRTELGSTLGKLLLANSITLTPGTLTVDVLEDRLEVHWIDITPGADLERATRAIAGQFERHLKEFLR